MFKENWPNDDNFGIISYRLIKSYLSSILLSKTKNEWGIVFYNASELFVESLTKLELLKKIYSNPTYYARYVTQKVVGNLSCNGSTPAEQNHASIVSFKGENMLTSVCEHIKYLLERQQQLSNKENGKEIEAIVRQHRYNPQLEGEMANDEVIARGVLS